MEKELERLRIFVLFPDLAKGQRRPTFRSVVLDEFAEMMKETLMARQELTDAQISAKLKPVGDKIAQLEGKGRREEPEVRVFLAFPARRATLAQKLPPGHHMKSAAARKAASARAKKWWAERRQREQQEKATWHRRYMTTAQRKEVSERMKKYWADRRKARK